MVWFLPRWITGGLDVRIVLGGRGTHVRAGLGGHHGRPLRRGDRIAIGGCPFDCVPPGARTALRANGKETSGSGSVSIVPPPEVARFAAGALERLLATEWRLSPRRDRMGTRLEGAAVAHAGTAVAQASAPLIIGAIEIPPDGTPIVLGPEHLTTGGDPVIAVIAAADLDAFHLRPIGSVIRFAR